MKCYHELLQLTITCYIKVLACFLPILFFRTTWHHQKTGRFSEIIMKSGGLLMFPWSIEREQWPKMEHFGYQLYLQQFSNSHVQNIVYVKLVSWKDLVRESVKLIKLTYKGSCLFVVYVVSKVQTLYLTYAQLASLFCAFLLIYVRIY